MEKVEIGKIFCLTGDIWILFSKKCLLSSLVCLVRVLSKSLNFSSCHGNIFSVNFQKNIKVSSSLAINGLRVKLHVIV